MILTMHSCDRAAHLASHHLSLCVHLWDCLFRLMGCSPEQCTCSRRNISLCDDRSHPVYPHFLSHRLPLSVSAPPFPAWAQLKQFPFPSASGLWWQHFACDVPVRGLHYALLKKTLFDLTRFYFEGPSLKNSHHRPLNPPPLLIILHQKREKNM